MGAGGGRHRLRTPSSRTAAPGPRARAAAPSGPPSVPWSRRPCLETQGPDRGHAKVGQGVRVTSRFAWPQEPGPQRLGERPTLLSTGRWAGGRPRDGHPDTHHVVSFIEDHDRPLQVDAVCPATLRQEGREQGCSAGSPPASGARAGGDRGTRQAGRGSGRHSLPT